MEKNRKSWNYGHGDPAVISALMMWYGFFLMFCLIWGATR